MTPSTMDETIQAAVDGELRAIQRRISQAVVGAIHREAGRYGLEVGYLHASSDDGLLGLSWSGRAEAWRQELVNRTQANVAATALAALDQGYPEDRDEGGDL